MVIKPGALDFHGDPLTEEVLNNYQAEADRLRRVAFDRDEVYEFAVFAKRDADLLWERAGLTPPDRPAIRKPGEPKIIPASGEL